MAGLWLALLPLGHAASSKLPELLLIVSAIPEGHSIKMQHTQDATTK